VYDFVSQASFPVLAVAITGALLALNIVASGAGVIAERAFSHYRVWDVALRPGQLRWEILANLRFDVVVGVCTAALISSGVVRLAVPDATGGTDWATACTTFAITWVCFEVYYWCMHRAMHLRALYRFHRWHHESRVTTAFTGNSTSTVEALGWAVGFAVGPLLLSVFGTVSLGAWALYFLYNYSGNIVGHINADFFPKIMNSRSQTWMIHPITYHALHHARFVNHYSFGSSFMDRLLGTEWDDWQGLHDLVRNGHPMTSLSQRLQKPAEASAPHGA
jgi:sterol desaturase/sphingolipid hydroxylase (fatty acid hydroxylase superfamily)